MLRRSEFNAWMSLVRQTQKSASAIGKSALPPQHRTFLRKTAPRKSGHSHTHTQSVLAKLSRAAAAAGFAASSGAENRGIYGIMETLEKGGLMHALTTDSSSSPFMLRNQIDARSHLQIASADHLTREMGHMAECVLHDQKAKKGSQTLSSWTRSTGGERPSIGIYMTWTQLLQSPSLLDCDNWA